MKNLQHWIWMVTIAIPTFLMAQPPEEEVAPTAPEFNIEITDAPSPEPAPAEAAAAPISPAANAQLTPALSTLPIAPPAAPAEVKDDNTVKGITLAPAVTLKPLGYNADRSQTFFEVSPAIGLNSTFKSAQKKDIAFNAAYAFIWDEFMTNRSAGLRYFEHDLSGSATMEWSSLFSTSMTGGFNYSLWASDAREHAVFSDDAILGIFKLNEQVTVSTGYRLFFFNDLDTQFRLSDGTFPSDGDDIRQGNSAISGSDQFYIDPASPTFNYDPTVGNSWFANNGLQLNTSFKPMKDTTLGLNYEYVFATFTNDANADWKGHWITASISQAMPWKGGSVSLKDQVRLRNYGEKVNDDGSLVSNLRNRVTLSIDQGINDTISANLWYRWEMSGSNADNYAVLKNLHYINFGFTFAF